MPTRRWTGRERREGNVIVPALASALVFAVAGGPEAGSAGGWRSPATRCEVMAGSLRVAPPLRGVVVDLCRRSPTFRRQVARLTDADGLTVTVTRLVMPPASTSLWRAQTLITRVGGLVRSADVQVPAGDARLVAELIAHEFEHILEQLDGVELKRWVGRSGVRRVGADREGSPIETERARRVGRLVANEYAAGAAEITALKVR
jgi:hypothetical protein